MILIDLTGQRFGRLAVVARAENRGREPHWLCACDCSASTTVSGASLRRGLTRSCGCLASELKSVRAFRHGMTRTPEWDAIHHARSRCLNERDPRYPLYGGRGIEYRLPADPGEALALLIESIGRRPDEKKTRSLWSLDRIDNDGHYEIGNLRWATASEQALNRRERVS